MEGPFGFPAPPPGMMPPPPAPAMAPIPPQPAGGLTEEMLQEKSRKYDLIFINQNVYYDFVYQVCIIFC